MTRSVSGQVVLVLAAILAGGAGPAWAQGQPPVARPYQGLFGGDNERVLRPQSLTVQGSVFAGYDDNVYAGQPGAGTGPGTIPGSGVLTGISLGLGYTRSFSRSSVSADLGGALRYYPESADQSAPSAFAGAGYSTMLDPRTDLAIVGTYRYLPYYRYSLLPGVGDSYYQAETAALGAGDVLVPPVDDDLISADQQVSYYTVDAEVLRRLSPRSEVSARYGYGLHDFSAIDTDDHYQRFGGLYRYRLNPDLDLRAGYLYTRRIAEEVETPYELHTIDTGFDYKKAFQFGAEQRTTLRFGVGPSIIGRASPEGDGTRPGDTDFLLTAIGSVSLYHRLSREWFASTAYNRSLRFIEGFADPALQDMVTASLGGYLGKRVNVVLRGSYSWGAVNLDDNNYDTGLASARVQYALTSRLATYAQYFYYRYHFDEDVVLPPGYVPQQERQGVRVGLNFWLPVLR